MVPEAIFFSEIVEKLTKSNSLVTSGKMMSSPGIKYKNKVFAFYFNKKMVFKLGKDFNPSLFDINSYNFLNPFKNKPPMTSWFEISFEDRDKWEKLTDYALKKIQSEME